MNYASQELHCQDLQGNGTAEKFAVFIDKLAKKADPKGLTVVVVDNASIHRAGLIKEKEAAWNAQGLYLRYLPPYSPHLNLIEAVWRKVKNYLLPRRLYASLSDLKDAVSSVIESLGGNMLTA